MREIVGLRAHRPSASFARFVERLTQFVPADDLFIVVDDLSGGRSDIWRGWPNVVFVTADLLQQLGLGMPVPDAGWRCGDYCYYALKESTAWDRAWLIEPDVAFLHLTPRDLFSAVDNAGADLVAVDIEQRTRSDWAWFNTLATKGVEEPWACLFPLTRISAAGADAALRLRIRLEATRGPWILEPNDEGIVATAIAQAGLALLDLRKEFPTWFEHFSFRPKYLSESLEAAVDSASVAHSVLSMEDYVEFLQRECARLRFRAPRQLRLTLDEHLSLLEPEFLTRVLKRLPLDVRVYWHSRSR